MKKTKGRQRKKKGKLTIFFTINIGINIEFIIIIRIRLLTFLKSLFPLSLQNQKCFPPQKLTVILAYTRLPVSVWEIYVCCLRKTEFGGPGALWDMMPQSPPSETAISFWSTRGNSKLYQILATLATNQILWPSQVG